jgi:hypothetical protein
MKKSLLLMIAVLILATASITLLAQATTNKLASGTYVVYAKSPQVWRVAVDSKMANATLTGHFATTAGTPMNLDVFVLNEADYMKWRKDDEAAPNAAKALFSSMKKADGDVNVKLSDGTYYLVFSDVYQYEGTKTFNADIKLQFDKK